MRNGPNKWVPRRLQQQQLPSLVGIAMKALREEDDDCSAPEFAGRVKKSYADRLHACLRKRYLGWLYEVWETLRWRVIEYADKGLQPKWITWSSWIFTPWYMPKWPVNGSPFGSVSFQRFASDLCRSFRWYVTEGCSISIAEYLHKVERLNALRCVLWEQIGHFCTNWHLKAH